MKLYKNLSKIYDLLYSYRDYDKEAEFLIGQLPRGVSPSFLDVACGTGAHLEAVRKKLPLARLGGIDLSKEMLAVAQKKSSDFKLVRADMRSFDIGRNFDMIYCLSGSIQYNLSQEDLTKTIHSMRKHAVSGKVIFDLAYCLERWREGYTNITANSNEQFEVAELYTSHSKDGFSYWNPLYLIKDKKTGKMDMHVDTHKIKLWSIPEVEDLLKSRKIDYTLQRGFTAKDISDIPVFILEGLKS